MVFIREASVISEEQVAALDQGLRSMHTRLGDAERTVHIEDWRPLPDMMYDFMHPAAEFGHGISEIYKVSAEVGTYNNQPRPALHLRVETGRGLERSVSVSVAHEQGVSLVTADIDYRGALSPTLATLKDQLTVFLRSEENRFMVATGVLALCQKAVR